VEVSEENDKGVCLRIEFGAFDAATCGDINGTDEGSRTDVESEVAGNAALSVVGGLPVPLGWVDRAGLLAEDAAQAFAMPGHPPVSPIRRSREGGRERGDRRAGRQQSCELRDGLAA
jgi:hypothetical protein